MRISDRFAERKAEGRSALVPYVTCGFPSADASVDVLSAMAAAGGDVLELGIPFSDPLADGPTIQASSHRALDGGMTVARTLGVLAGFRAVSDAPVVLFSYLNPVLSYGLESFIRDAVDAGAQGLLITDLPTGADPEVEESILDSPLDLIRLIAPTTAPDRISKVSEGGQGFLYYISRTGVTGARETLSDTLASEVREIKSKVDLPLAVGFGISTPEQAALVAGVADGVVVGSALVKALESGGIDEAGRLLASLRSAMDEGVEAVR